MPPKANINAKIENVGDSVLISNHLIETDRRHQGSWLFGLTSLHLGALYGYENVGKKLANIDELPTLQKKEVCAQLNCL